MSGSKEFHYYRKADPTRNSLCPSCQNADLLQGEILYCPKCGWYRGWRDDQLNGSPLAVKNVDI